jgi:hypothetical protein
MGLRLIGKYLFAVGQATNSGGQVAFVGRLTNKAVK